MLTWAEKKDQQDVLDYKVDWSNKVPVEDSITASAWTVPVGITKDSDSFDTNSTTIWLSGGTAGANYIFINHITTTLGRQWDQTVRLKMKER